MEVECGLFLGHLEGRLGVFFPAPQGMNIPGGV